MKQSGQVALIRFPGADLNPGKLRPVLLVCPAPGRYEDWLVCMLSTQLQQSIEGFDELVDEAQHDFEDSGLKVASVIRVARLAVVSTELLVGAIGVVDKERLRRIRKKLATWIQDEAH